MMLCEVLQPGLWTTIQDLGRPGWQQFGIPVAGAMDAYAFRLANRLLGNGDNAAALEMTLLGPTLRFRRDTVLALTGGDLAPELNGQAVPMWQTMAVRAGDHLTFGGVNSGCRAYLAVAGGFDVPVVLGSRSTYVRGSLGGLEGRPLKTGDILAAGQLRRQAGAGIRVPDYLIPHYSEEIEVRVVLGPEQNRFTPDSIRAFLSTPYMVTPEADRMGCRLAGPRLYHTGGADIISGGLPPGAVQVPGHGQPIIMLADRQTTGGYARIATVISADLPRLAQAKPGDRLCFTPVSVTEAQVILRQTAGNLACWPEKKKSYTYCITVNGTVYNTVVREV
ncbi:MAG TPA: biotin-dependent carboxyltransferase family protein [Negativicutes bacterium]|nr:biotin-dependent carboxyltransferase family protein [Negativicutes bacterium]